MLTHRPLHERWKPLGLVRGALRGRAMRLASRFFATHDGRQVLVDSLDGRLHSRPGILDGLHPDAPPYGDLGRAADEERVATGTGAVFISGRFRSGSTLLWNLFRNAGAFTAYYEPFNERRWFDPATRGDHTDRTHRGVSDYWREYEGLERLADCYRQGWIDHNLLMEPGDWDPAMRRYVELLLRHARRRPALQFNRADFRLAWLRREFPGATIVHIYRHPRDQWCSSLLGDVDRVPRDVTMTGFGPYDRFYLASWARDLQGHFPFLDERFTDRPYQVFYYLWKLSYLFGRRDSDLSVSFEDLVADPRTWIGRLFEAVGTPEVDVDRLTALVDRPPIGKWTRFADDGWFREQESECETVLRRFLSAGPSRPSTPAARGRVLSETAAAAPAWAGGPT